MLSIGRFAKLAGVSARTVRHYESLGLIAASSRGDNGYRYYDRSLVDRVKRIRELQALGFSLDEIHEVLKVPKSSFVSGLKRKLDEAEAEISALQKRRARIRTALSVSRKIDSGESVGNNERSQFMHAIQEEILNGIRNRCGEVTESHRRHLGRDEGMHGTPEKAELIEAVRKCVEFARARDLMLGPGRGSSPASLSLFGLGFSAIDPARHGLIPERLADQAPDIHIDVEFERGQEFVDFCRDVSRGLPYGQINAFKMPLLDIIKSVHARLGAPIEYGRIDDDSDTVLSHFRSGEIGKIFCFDLSEKALVMKYENHLPGYSGHEGSAKLREYLRSQPILSFRDVINIMSLWRPSSPEMLLRIARYREAKAIPVSHGFLAEELRESLKPNFGLVIYHEDLLRILHAYTGWDLARCNRLRQAARFNRPEAEAALAELRDLAPAPVVELFLQENPWAFCQPHAIAFAQLVKQTAVLKSLHREIYFEEIDRWERKHGLAWDDIGIRIKGVSLLQH